MSTAETPMHHHPDREQRHDVDRSTAGRLVPALILIALGVVFLLGNVLAISGIAISGGTLFIGLGVAFLIGRMLSGAYGLAVPAGILLGFGAFVALNEARLLAGEDGGWFFILLGLGFLAVYLIGWRPSVIWPLFPAAILTGFGTLILGVINVGPLAQYAWLGAYWPVVLIIVGLWLLVRDRVPPTVRGPLATLGVVLLVLYGMLVFAANVALATVPATGEWGRVQIGWPGVGAPLTETTELTAPINSAQGLTIINSSGETVVRAGSGGEVRVVATKHFWADDQQPSVTLVPVNGGLTLESTSPARSFFGRSAYVDYLVEVPAGVPVVTRSASGDIIISGLDTAIEAETSSGQLRVSDLSDKVSLRSSSGDMMITNVTGELRVVTSSGDIQINGLEQLREVVTSSGDLRLSGRLAGDARVQTSSGDVTVRLMPDSAVRVAVATSSGDIEVEDLPLTNRQQDRRSLTGTLGDGTYTLTIATSSGDVTLAPAT